MIRRPPRSTLFPYTNALPIYFLLLVDDEARQGALRFAEREGGPFVREEGVKRIPPLVELQSGARSEEHTSELQSRPHLVCRLLLEKKNKKCQVAFVSYRRGP